MEHTYPFAAIVGQEPMKRALLLNLIDPALGGVLIRGEKGTAKSTAVRGLTDLLDDHIVDILLDSAAMSVNTVEREGVSYATPPGSYWWAP